MSETMERDQQFVGKYSVGTVWDYETLGCDDYESDLLPELEIASFSDAFKIVIAVWIEDQSAPNPANSGIDLICIDIRRSGMEWLTGDSDQTVDDWRSTDFPDRDQIAEVSWSDIEQHNRSLMFAAQMRAIEINRPMAAFALLADRDGNLYQTIISGARYAIILPANIKIADLLEIDQPDYDLSFLDQLFSDLAPADLEIIDLIDDLDLGDDL